MPFSKPSILKIERLFPRSRPICGVGEVRALSLLDATTATYGLTNAIWLFEPPTSPKDAGFSLTDHLSQSLQAALDAYPQWCGQWKSVQTIDGTVDPEAQHLPPHSRRFGRIYVRYGTSHDPGVELVVGSSLETLDVLHPRTRTKDLPIWDCRKEDLDRFAPATKISHYLRPDEPDEQGRSNPLLAVQITKLADGGMVLAVKSAHPLADISALIHFVKDWASISRARLADAPEPLLKPVFNPGMLDSLAAGDIDATEPDDSIVQLTKTLPLHRYDWWTPSPGCPWPTAVPEVFKGKPLEPAGKVMPWSEWKVGDPVSKYTIHLTHQQVESLWKQASQDGASRVSRHDAILAHVWSCIVRARNLQDDGSPVYCDIVLGVRPAFNLGENFIGSPIIMMMVEMTGKEVGSGNNGGLGHIARRVRETVQKVAQPQSLSAHLHALAYEKSPQRIWQAFLGRRHVLVTSWARAGIYGVDFGLGCGIRYADGVIPNVDGDILVKEAPPCEDAIGETNGATFSSSWTGNGVDISIHIGTEDMERLVNDPLLLPRC